VGIRRGSIRGVHTSLSAAFKNEKHRKQWLSSLEYVISAFGTKHIDSITSADILAALNPVWLVRPETSRRVLQRIRVIFDWCKAQGFCSGDNPTEGITKVLPKHRASQAHHASLPYVSAVGALGTIGAADGADLPQPTITKKARTASRGTGYGRMSPRLRCCARCWLMVAPSTC
jgi:hypothetical protein